MTTVIYIAPAQGILAGQCRIYRAEFTGCINGDGIHTHYRNNPERYAEAGIMSSRGKLVCFDGTPEQRQDLLDCQPLMAGLVFTYDEPGASA
ncbi:MAG: hypothetical protein Q7U48_13745 [Hydrogenophaga sp.]|nr:hypothetical protein [Hydrogenophaga sp.]